MRNILLPAIGWWGGVHATVSRGHSQAGRIGTKIHTRRPRSLAGKDTRFKTKLTAYMRIRVAPLQWPRLWCAPGLLM